jgi:phosphatidylglycerophosphate synthase
MDKLEVRERFYRLLTPLARSLAWLHPNTISALALVTGCLAGVAYGFSGIHGGLFFVAAALVVASGILDAVDGLVARMTGRTSTFGDFLDHFFDRVVDAAIMLGLALSPHGSLGLGVVATVLVILNAYLGTQIVASFGSRDYSGLGKAEFVIALVLGSLVLGIEPGLALTVADLRLSLVDLLLALIGLGSIKAIVHRLRLAARLARKADSE